MCVRMTHVKQERIRASSKSKISLLHTAHGQGGPHSLLLRVSLGQDVIGFRHLGCRSRISTSASCTPCHPALNSKPFLLMRSMRRRVHLDSTPWTENKTTSVTPTRLSLRHASGCKSVIRLIKTRYVHFPTFAKASRARATDGPSSGCVKASR